jgi:carboxyl-terminal processing protease
MNVGVRILAVAAGVSAAFAVGFAWSDLTSTGKVNPGAFQSLTRTNAPKAAQKKPTELFVGEYNRISASYSRKVNQEQVLYSGMDGMLTALGDPHTNFFDPYVTREFTKVTMGQDSFGGVGARLAPDSLGVKVIQVFKEGPAFKIGFKSGDIIIGVNGESVGGQTTDQIVSKIKGKVGSTVKVKVLRGGNKTIEYAVVRGKINPPSADGNVIESSNIGYLLVTGFDQKTHTEFFDSINDLERQGIQGLIIDMRNNGGGLLETAQMMIAGFKEFATVVTMRRRGEAEEVVRTPGGMLRDFKYPVVVLVNENSASAAEIFAGCLRDYKLATLVGEHTYGKASVQNVIPIAGGTTAKVTIAHYALPSGDDISRKVDEDGQYVSGGIKPEYEVELSLKPDVSLGDAKTDNQLQKAMEIIRKKNPRAK